MPSRIVVEIAGNEGSLQAATVKAADALKALSDVVARTARASIASGDEIVASNRGVADSFTVVSAESRKSSQTVAGAVVVQRDAVARAAAAQIGANDELIASIRDVAAQAGRAADAMVAASERTAVASQASAAKAGVAFGATGGALTSMGKKVTVALAAVGAGSVYAAAKFQTATTQFVTQIGMSEKAAERLKNGILDMAASVGQTPDQLAGGMYHVASSLNTLIPPAHRTATELGILKVAAEGAAIGGSDLTQTTYVLSGIMNSLGQRTVPQARRSMAELNAIVGAGTMHMQDLMNAMSTGIVPMARQFGLSLASMGAALATLADKGIPAQQAALRLRMVITEMGAPTKMAAGILEKLGLSSQQAISSSQQVTKMLEKAGVSTTRIADDLRRPDGILVALEDLRQHLMASGLSATGAAATISRSFGGIRGAAIVENLYQSLDKLHGKFDQINSTASQFGPDWQKTRQTFTFQVHQIEAGAIALGVRFGDFLMPKVEAVIGAFKDAANWMDHNQTAARVLGGVITGVLGVAVAAFTINKIAGLINGVRNATGEIRSLAGVLTGTLRTAFNTAGDSATMMQQKVTTATSTMAADTEAADTKIQTSNATAGGSFTMIATDAATATRSVAASEGTLVSEVATADTTIEADNAAAGASFKTLLATGLGALGPLAVALNGVLPGTSGSIDVSKKLAPFSNTPENQAWAGRLSRGFTFQGHRLDMLSSSGQLAAAMKAFNTQWLKTHPLANVTGGAQGGPSAIANLAGSAAAAPVGVAAMLATAQALVGTKYTWGGGHSGFDTVAALKKIGVDCSGFVSQVLHAGGVKLPSPMDTGGLANYLKPGRGQYVTVWDATKGSASQQHVIINIAGKWYESGGVSGGVGQMTQSQAQDMIASMGMQPYHPTSMTTKSHGGTGGTGGTGGAGGGGGGSTGSYYWDWQTGRYQQLTSAQYKKLEAAWYKQHPHESMPSGPTSTSITGPLRTRHFDPFTGAYKMMTSSEYRQLVTQWQKQNPTLPMPSSPTSPLTPATVQSVSSTLAGMGHTFTGSASSITAAIQAANTRAGTQGSSMLSRLQSAIGTNTVASLRSVLGAPGSEKEKNFHELVQTLKATHETQLEKLAKELVHTHRTAMRDLAAASAVAAERAYNKMVTQDATALSKRSSDLGTLYQAGAAFGLPNQTGTPALVAQEIPLTGSVTGSALGGVLATLIPQLEAGMLSKTQAAGYASVFTGGALGTLFGGLASGKLNATDTNAAYDTIYQLIGSLASLQGAVDQNTSAVQSNMLALLQQQNLTLSEGLALSEGQTSVLRSFIPTLPRYDIGGPVLQDGPIYAHAGEHVVPANGSLVMRDTSPSHLHLHMDGDLGGLMKMVDARFSDPHNAMKVSYHIGRRTSQLSGAPGGGRR